MESGIKRRRRARERKTMGLFDGVLIASDIDMTFLSSQGQVLARNAESIRAFCADGGRFCFATGRTHCSLEQLIPGIGALANTPCILSNGSYVCDLRTDKIENEIALDPAAALPFFTRIAALFPQVGFRISIGDEFYVPIETERMQSELGLYRGHLHPVPLTKVPPQGWNKVVFHGTPEQLLAVRAAMEEDEHVGAFAIMHSSPVLLEVLSRGASKGVQLRYLKEKYSRCGIPITTYGIGDYENDLPLLLAADVAVCPANAQQCVKEKSALCVCSNDDGAIADLIDRIARQRRKEKNA